MPLPAPTLQTTRLRLRPFDDTDADDLFALHSDAHVLRFWDSPPWSAPERAERFITACRQMAEGGTGARLAVDRDSDGAFLGWCSLNRWNPDFRSASVGYCFAEAAWGHGYATEAARALLGWAFDTLDLNRVQAEADTRNVASARVLEKLGFVREGTLAGGLRRERRGLRLLGLRAAPAGVAASPGDPTATPARHHGRVTLSIAGAGREQARPRRGPAGAAGLHGQHGVLRTRPIALREGRLRGLPALRQLRRRPPQCLHDRGAVRFRTPVPSGHRGRWRGASTGCGPSGTSRSARPGCRRSSRCRRTSARGSRRGGSLRRRRAGRRSG